MPLLRFAKTFEQTRKIKIRKSLKRVDSDCIFLVFSTLPVASDDIKVVMRVAVLASASGVVEASSE